MWSNKKAAFVSHHKRQDATKSATPSSNPPEQEQEHEEEKQIKRGSKPGSAGTPRTGSSASEQEPPPRGRRETLELGSPSPPVLSTRRPSSSAPSESRNRRTCLSQWNIQEPRGASIQCARREVLVYGRWRRHFSRRFASPSTAARALFNGTLTCTQGRADVGSDLLQHNELQSHTNG